MRARDEAAAAGTLYTDLEFVGRAIRNARPREPGKFPRWSVVMGAFACGSTLANGLCRRFGLDPDELLEGPTCDFCQSDEEE